MDHESLIATKTNPPKPADFMEDLDDMHLSDAQKMELLETLFQIMKTFVEIGYGMEPVNKLLAEFENYAKQDPNLIDSEMSKKGGIYE